MNLLHRLHRWWNCRLRHKLLAISITTLSISLILLGGLSYEIGKAVVGEGVQSHNAQIAALAAKDVNHEFADISTNTRLFLNQILDKSLSQQARAMLDLRLNSPLTYRALYLLNHQGDFLIYVNEPLGKLIEITHPDKLIGRPPLEFSPPLQEAYSSAKAGEFYLSEPVIEGADQIPIVWLGIPLVSADELPSQILLAEIDLRDIWRKVDEIRIGRTGQVFIASKDGLILAHPDRSFIGQIIPPALRILQTERQRYTHYRNEQTDEKMLVAHSFVVGQTGWSIFVEQTEFEALAPVGIIYWVTLGVLVVALVGATIATMITASTITKPLQHLAQTTRTIADTGNLEQDIYLPQTDEVGQLAETFNQMMATLRSAQTRLLAAQALEQELKIARQIQASLLPHTAPHAPGLDIAGRMIPAREVGGDFYGYYTLNTSEGSSFAISVGDVAGKGVPAALYMAVSASAIAAKAQETPQVANFCQELNHILYPQMSNNRMNVALLYIYLDSTPSGWLASMVNAGLTFPLLCHDNQSQYLDIGGMPLGALPNIDYLQKEQPLISGDWLVLCSDGIIEAMSSTHEMYGFDRLQQCVETTTVSSAQEMIETVFTDVDHFTSGAAQHDDMTVVVIRVV